MSTTLETTSISSLELIRLVNQCRERQAHASGVSFPSQTFPRIEHADIQQKAKELLGATSKSSAYIFSPRQAHVVSSGYGPFVQDALFDFFEQQQMPKVEPTKTQATHSAPVASKLQMAMGTNVEPVTMTSLEMVDYINSSREAGKAELRHDNFMAKVPKVLGEAAPKFLGTGFYANGTGSRVARSIYIFPKREACLMAMSYSYELQAKVFDRMTELEAQQAQPAATPYGQMHAPMSQMMSMLSEGYGKLEHELQRLNGEVEFLKTTLLLQRPAPKPRKDPNRIPGPLDWQLAKTIQSIRFNFSIAPHEIGLERFYLYLHGLKSASERSDALRTALHLGIKIDNTMPTDFPVDAKNIRFKFSVSENDPRLKDVLDMLIGLPDDKARRTSLKRYLVAKSTNAPQMVNLSFSVVQHKQEQPGLF